MHWFGGQIASRTVHLLTAEAWWRKIYKVGLIFQLNSISVICTGMLLWRSWADVLFVLQKRSEYTFPSGLYLSWRFLEQHRGMQSFLLFQFPTSLQGWDVADQVFHLFPTNTTYHTTPIQGSMKSIGHEIFIYLSHVFLRNWYEWWIVSALVQLIKSPLILFPDEVHISISLPDVSFFFSFFHDPLPIY